LLASLGAENGKSPVPPSHTPGRPLSPFSNALHGFGGSLGSREANELEKSAAKAKMEADEPKSILEQIHKDENSVMLPPSSTPRVTGSTPGTAILSVSPKSGTGSTQAGTPGWVAPKKSGKSPDDTDKADDGSEEEEAADLLVYFHARSGGSESAAVDESIEVPGDEPRPNRKRSSSGDSSPIGATVRKRKRNDGDEEFAGLTSTSNPGKAGVIFPGKPDGSGTAKEVGKGLYLDQNLPTGSVDVLNLLRRPPNQGSS
jgi:hypothetical protein